MLDSRRAVVMKAVVVMSGDVTTREDLFEVLEEGRVYGHNIFEVAVRRAVLDHKDFAVTLDDLSLDLTDFVVKQNLVRELAVKYLLADVGHATRAERVCGARPAERRLGLLERLEQGLIGPVRSEGRVLVEGVKAMEQGPGGLGGEGKRFLEVLNWFMHSRFLLVVCEASDWAVANVVDERLVVRLQARVLAQLWKSIPTFTYNLT
jgi:hypothetical protein